jgi:hypothetical protein
MSLELVTGTLVEPQEQSDKINTIAKQLRIIVRLLIIGNHTSSNWGLIISMQFIAFGIGY